MNDKTTDVHLLAERLNDEMLEALDEELELELDDDRLNAALEHVTDRQPKEAIDRHTYFRELLRLQRELIRLQISVVHQKLKLVVLFEGRDAAGKGGVIKRVTQRLNPPASTATGLPARARRTWWFKRFDHLPAAGEMTACSIAAGTTGLASNGLWDFALRQIAEEFLRTVPESSDWSGPVLSL